MALPRLETSSPVAGNSFWRLESVSLGNMGGQGHPVLTARAVRILDVGGVQQILAHKELSITIYEDDILGEDGVTVVTPNNLATQVQIINQSTGAVKSTVTYSQIFEFMLSLAQHIRANGT